jgi:hypothetical protein
MERKANFIKNPRKLRITHINSEKKYNIPFLIMQYWNLAKSAYKYAKRGRKYLTGKIKKS